MRASGAGARVSVEKKAATRTPSESAGNNCNRGTHLLKRAGDTTAGPSQNSRLFTALGVPSRQRGSMELGLKGMVPLLTGASRGLGQAIVHQSQRRRRDPVTAAARRAPLNGGQPVNTQRSRYQHIWQPISIGNVEVKNRILMTAMTSNRPSLTDLLQFIINSSSAN